MPRDLEQRALHRFLGILTCWCLLVQPLLGQLHLAVADHTYAGVLVVSTPAATDGDDRDEDRDPPHPAEDHDQAPGIRTSFAVDLAPLACVTVPGAHIDAPPPAERAPPSIAARVDHPPPRAPGRPRAPPRAA